MQEARRERALVFLAAWRLGVRNGNVRSRVQEGVGLRQTPPLPDPYRDRTLAG